MEPIDVEQMRRELDEAISKFEKAAKRFLRKQTSVEWEVKQAIIEIHHNAEYFRGLDRLRRIIDRETLLNQYDNEKEQARTCERFNEWVKSRRGE